MSSASCKIFAIPRLLLIIILIINLFSSYATAQTSTCTTNGGYTNNSTFDVNLQTIFSTFLPNLPDNGYYAASITDLAKAETVTAFTLCRGDQTPAQCRWCVQSAPPTLYQRCRNHRQGVLYSNLNCMVRYIDATLTLSPPSQRSIYFRNFDAVNAAQFRADRDALLRDLRALAAGGSALKVGGGSRRTWSVGSQSNAIYGLMQCRPDLSSGECRTCLETAAAALQGCCDIKTWVQVNTPDCYIEYQLRNFYNETRLSERGVLLPRAGARNVGPKKITSKNGAYNIF